MKRTILSLLLTGLLFISFCPDTVAKTTAQVFFKGIENYTNKNYQEAVRAFESIHETGINNGHLYYNIGNAYFKQGNKGMAIVWYERAKNLIPNDPDLNYNYEYVKGLIKDKIPSQTSPVIQILFFWKDLMGKKGVQWAGLFMLSILCVIIVIRKFRYKRPVNTFIIVLTGLTALFIGTASYDYYRAAHVKKGVIVKSEVSARSGLSEDATALFTLHEGSLLTITETRKGYYKIALKDGKIGWISTTFIELI